MEYNIIQNIVFSILNPHIILEFKTNFNIQKLEIIINKKIYKQINYKKNFERHVKIDEDLPKNIQKLEVYIYGEGNKIQVYSKNYGYFIRTVKVISKPFRVILDILKRILRPIVKAIKIMWERHHFIIPPSKLKRYFKSFLQNYKHPPVATFLNPERTEEYNKWLNLNKSRLINTNLEYNPLFSIIIPVYNAEGKYLKECIDSVLNQTYQNFEICISDDNSSNKDTLEVLKEYEKNDKIKINYRKSNGMISKNMNSAIELSNGEFIAFLDNDDVLDKNALYYMAKELNDNKKLDMIYSDEDKISENGTYCEPNFKPDFSPDTLLSMNYICHFTCIRKKILDKVGLFNSEFDGAQDYDLFLRVSEVTKKIGHVHKILYHWRKSSTSTAALSDNKGYARIAGKKALEAALKRRKIDAEVILDEKTPFYRINYILKKEPSVSIIIPTKDAKDILEKCINSILENTTYKNYEIVVVDNNSIEEETLKYFKEIKKKYKNIKVLKDKGEFNYSRINNNAIKKTNSEYILLLNNDTEVITKNWLTTMVGYAKQKHVGCVGAKLLYPDYTIQHAGVVLGLGGVASHVYIGSDRNELGYLGRLCVPYNYSANTAACLMVSRKKIDEVGGLDEDLKVAYNDMDFNIKLLEKGYYNVFLPQVELIHYESKTRGFDTKGEKKKRFDSEVKYMYNKWYKQINNDKYYNNNFSKKGWFLLERRK